MTRSWAEIWSSRQLDPTIPSTLRRLMAADGLDTGFGSVDESAWQSFVLRSAERLGVDAEASVYEVGCGAGAFLYPLAELGCAVGGLDASPALVGFAASVMPRGQFETRDAAALDEAPQWDHVVSCGVALYFPDLAYLSTVIRKMVRKARRGVALLEIADAARKQEAMSMRRGHLGEQEYQERYAGLDHLYVERSFVETAMREAGLTRVVVEDQAIGGYQNSAYRFNAFGWR